MLGMGLGEMILIAGIALVVIGPEKFPDFAKIVLRTFRDIRGYVEEAKDDLSKEFRPVKDEVRSLSRYKPEDYLDAMSPSKSGKDPADEAVIASGTQAYGTGEDNDFTYNPEPDEADFKRAGTDEVGGEVEPEEAPSRDDPVSYAPEPYEMEREENTKGSPGDLPGVHKAPEIDTED